MTLRITDTEISSDVVAAVAQREQGGAWSVVSWELNLSGLDRNGAITAVTLAELQAKDGKSVEDDLLIESFRDELGLA